MNSKLLDVLVGLVYFLASVGVSYLIVGWTSDVLGFLSIFRNHIGIFIVCACGYALIALLAAGNILNVVRVPVRWRTLATIVKWLPWPLFPIWFIAYLMVGTSYV